MLNTQALATSNHRSPSIVVLDPLVMRRPLAHETEARPNGTARIGIESELFAGNPFAIASPFCNPEF